MEEITWDAIILALIIIAALAFLVRKFAFPTSRCGCGSSCGCCDGNTYSSRKKDGDAQDSVNKCYVMEQSKGNEE